MKDDRSDFTDGRSDFTRGCITRGIHTRTRVQRLELIHKRPYVGVSQGTVLGFGDGFGAILWETVAKS